MREFNNIKKISAYVLIIVIALATVISPFKVKAEAYNVYNENTFSNYEAWVYDDAELLTEDEADKILENAYFKLTDYTDIYIVTTKENPYGDSDTSTKDYCDAIHEEFCDSDSCIILMLDLYAGYVRIDAYGNVSEKINTEQRGVIVNNIAKYTTEKDYYNCILSGIEQIYGYYFEGFSENTNNGTKNGSSTAATGTTSTPLTKKNTVSGFNAGVFDDAGLLSQTEKTSLLDEAYKYTEFGDIFVVTADHNPYGDSQSATASLCKDYFNRYSSGSNCVIFIIDMATRYIYIDTYGNQIRNNLTNGKCDSITDNVYDYASDKDYYQCSMTALEQIGKVLNGMAIAEPMKVVSNLFIAFVCGFVIMYLVAMGKSKVGTPSDDELLKYAAINFTANNPRDIVTGTTKTYCPRSSGSSGGGRSGGGGGGGSHGGGGHRF